MLQPDFQIEFSYNGAHYLGLVRPIGNDPGSGHCIILESENQELYLEILAKQAASPLQDWDFQCGEGEDAAYFYDRELLQEIAEHLDAHLETHGSVAAAPR